MELEEEVIMAYQVVVVAVAVAARCVTDVHVRRNHGLEWYGCGRAVGIEVARN